MFPANRGIDVLAPVIQAGGEDEMWALVRYDRWSAHQTDWTLPNSFARTSHGPQRAIGSAVMQDE